jgi:hypothetical protein
MVSKRVWSEFHAQWAAIDRLWTPCGDPEHIDAVAGLRMSARDELREKVRRDSLEEENQGTYLVPV